MTVSDEKDNRVLSKFGRWINQYSRVIYNWNTGFLDYLKVNELWDFRSEEHGGDGEFMPENLAEALITAVEIKGKDLTFEVREAWIEDAKYVYLLESGFHLNVKHDFFVLCSGTIGEPEGSYYSESSIQKEPVDAPWQSEVEFIQDRLEAKDRWEELCEKFFGSVPEYCECGRCIYRTQGKLCEKHLETSAAQEALFN